MNENTIAASSISPHRVRAKTISNSKEYNEPNCINNPGLTSDNPNSSEKPLQAAAIKSKNIKNTVRWSSPAPEFERSNVPPTQVLNQNLVQDQTEASVNKIAEYFRAELLMAGEDLQLLEKFNLLTKEQFEEMSSTAQDLLAGGSKMQQAFSDFEPLLSQIDEISLQVDYLELVANELDEYSYELEEKVKNLKRRKELQKKPLGSNTNSGLNILKR